MTDPNPTTAAPAPKPAGSRVLRIVVDADLGDPPGYGHDQMSIWIEGAKQPAPAAAMVRMAETGEAWDALGWSPDGPRELEIETSHANALARAILHAREVAAGTEHERAERLRHRSRREQARWDALENDTAPPIAFPD